MAEQNALARALSGVNVGANRKQRISKRIKKDAKADAVRRRREQWDAMLKMASAGPLPKLMAFARKVIMSALQAEMIDSGAMSFLSAMVCKAGGLIRRERWVAVEVPSTDAPCSCHLVKKSTAAATVMVRSRGSSTCFLGFRISRRSPAEK
jgi:hypothetical protein